MTARKLKMIHVARIILPLLSAELESVLNSLRLRLYWSV